MLRLKLFIIAFFMLISCSEGLNEHQKLAKRFLTSFYSYDFRDLYPISTVETQKVLKELERNIGEKPAKGTFAIPLIEVLECYETDSVVKCRYTIRNDKFDESALSFNIEIVKESGEWKVNYYKEP